MADQDRRDRARQLGESSGLRGLLAGRQAQQGEAAGAEIVDLEGELAKATGDAAKKLRTDIGDKSIAARVVSSQTAMLVLESERDYETFGIDRTALADILVVGPKG
ncbi:MAG: hypothetical protein ACREJ0_21485, partial [Geminicoccaceae bacterium]